MSIGTWQDNIGTWQDSIGTWQDNIGTGQFSRRHATLSEKARQHLC